MLGSVVALLRLLHLLLGLSELWGHCACCTGGATTREAPQQAATCPSAHPPARPRAAQGELIGRLQQLLPAKAGRRIVYQQKEEGKADGGAA